MRQKNITTHNPATGIANGEVYRVRSWMKLREFREGDTSFIKDQKFLREFNKVQDITLVSPHRCYYLWKNANKCKNIPGAFAQVGIYKGGSAKLISNTIGKSKRFFLFDTFKGLPSHNPIDGMYRGDFSDVSYKDVLKLFSNNKKATITKGLFPNSAKGVIKGEKFAFVYLDADLYKSNKEALEFFYPRMAKGGVIIIDDYGEKHLKGIEKSTNEFFADKKQKVSVTTIFQCLIQF